MATKEELRLILKDFKSRKSSGGYTPTHLTATGHFNSGHHSGDALRLCDPGSKDYYQLKKLLNRYA